MEKISYERCVYESVDDKSLYYAISQYSTGKKASNSNGLINFETNEIITRDHKKMLCVSLPAYSFLSINDIDHNMNEILSLFM